MIELLTVIAIIGILCAILIPSTQAARTATKRAQTKVRFAQWAAALELFRQEYGYYPDIADAAGKVDPAKFAAALTGRKFDGSPIESDSAANGNTRRIRFYDLTEGELSAARTALADAFGNSDIAVLWDHNGDGFVNEADGAAPAVTGIASGRGWAPSASDLALPAGVRAAVLFYSAGRGESADDLVLSWK